MLSSSVSVFEIVSLSVSGLVLILYNSFALFSGKTNLGLMLKADDEWSRRHRMTSGNAADVTAAIQTLRNSVLVSVFIGTVTFNTMIDAHKSLKIYNKYSFLWLANLVVAVLYACSFLSFCICIRCAAHSGYLIGDFSFLEIHDDSRTKEKVLSRNIHFIHLIRMQSVHFSFAFRLAYSGLPFLFSSAGPEALLSVAVLIVLFESYVDFSHRFLFSYSWVTPRDRHHAHSLAQTIQNGDQDKDNNTSIIEIQSQLSRQ